MRIALAACLVIAACDSRTGAYIAIEGGSVTFDHVELYVGTGNATVIPRTPETAAQLSEPAPGKRFTRQFADTDRYDLPAPATHLDYYVPSGARLNGAQYVAAIAYSGQVPVAIGELFDVTVPTDTLYEYTIELAPFDPNEVELWGDGSEPGCLRYSRARTSEPATIAVVRADDSDCDAVIGKLDCEDLAYCRAGDICATKTKACVAQDNGDCTIGVCADGTGCMPTTCTIPGVCADTCLGMPDIVSQETCGLEQSLNHQDITVPCVVDPLFHPLCDPFVAIVPPPPDASGVAVPCTSPQIEAPAGGISDGYKFAITHDAGGANCIITLTSQDLGIPFDHTPDHHLLISVAAASQATPARWTFVLGFVGMATTATLCDTSNTVQSNGSGTTMSCAH